MAHRYDEIRKILEEVLEIVKSDDTDIFWSCYNSVEDLVEDLYSLMDRLRRGDETAQEDVRLLFAPTGSLQEISISSGWGNQFVNIASKIDELLG